MDSTDRTGTSTPITDLLRVGAPRVEPRLARDEWKIVHDSLTLALDPTVDLPWKSTVGDWTVAERAHAQALWDELTSLRLDAVSDGRDALPDYRSARVALRKNAFEALQLLDDVQTCISVGDLDDALRAARGFRWAARAVLGAVSRMHEALHDRGSV